MKKEITTKEEFDKISQQAIGMGIESFRELGYQSRVVNADGNTMVVTCDYKPYRFNLTTINNIITECHGG